MASFTKWQRNWWFFIRPRHAKTLVFLPVTWFPRIVNTTDYYYWQWLQNKMWTYNVHCMVLKKYIKDILLLEILRTRERLEIRVDTFDFEFSDEWGSGWLWEGSNEPRLPHPSQKNGCSGGMTFSAPQYWSYS